MLAVRMGNCVESMSSAAAAGDIDCRLSASCSRVYQQRGDKETFTLAQQRRVLVCLACRARYPPDPAALARGCGP